MRSLRADKVRIRAAVAHAIGVFVSRFARQTESVIGSAPAGEATTLAQGAAALDVEHLAGRVAGAH